MKYAVIRWTDGSVRGYRGLAGVGRAISVSVNTLKKHIRLYGRYADGEWEVYVLEVGDVVKNDLVDK